MIVFLLAMVPVLCNHMMGFSFFGSLRAKKLYFHRGNFEYQPPVYKIKYPQIIGKTNNLQLIIISSPR